MTFYLAFKVREAARLVMHKDIHRLWKEVVGATVVGASKRPPGSYFHVV